LRDGDAGLLVGAALPASEDARGQPSTQPNADRQDEQRDDGRKQQRRYHTHAKIVRIR
jgi:hypothetical protein